MMNRNRSVQKAHQCLKPEDYNQIKKTSRNSETIGEERVAKLPDETHTVYHSVNYLKV